MNGKTLDCSDLDNYMGKPMTPWSLREPLHNSDFRRWVQAMHYPNLLPAFTGDVTILTGEVIGKMTDEGGRNLVQVSCRMTNQLGTTLATAKAEVELPS